MPVNILEFLTKDANLKQTLMINYVKFHYKFCLNKLIRANCKRKRPYDTVEEPVHASPAKTRKRSQCDDGGNVCLLVGLMGLMTQYTVCLLLSATLM